MCVCVCVRARACVCVCVCCGLGCGIGLWKGQRGRRRCVTSKQNTISKNTMNILKYSIRMSTKGGRIYMPIRCS